jgi:TusA-related sulfurtransferase
MDEYAIILDCKGLSCPLPIAKLAKEIKSMESGEKIKIYATDLGFEADIKAWTQITGNNLDKFETVGTNFVAVVIKA